MSAVVALAGLTLAALGRAGSGVLAAPPTASWGAASTWYDHVGAATATLALLRLLALAGAAWLGVGASLQLLASLSLRRPVARLADALSPRLLRQLAHGAASLSVTAGLSVPALTAASALPAGDPPGTAVMEVLDDPPPGTSSSTTSTPTSPPPPPPPTPVTSPAVPADVNPTNAEVTVEPGDCFWSLAVEAVAEVRGSRPTDQQVVGYWQRLIEANRDRLVAPGNPDLLRPGQVLVLPEVDAAG